MLFLAFIILVQHWKNTKLAKNTIGTSHSIFGKYFGTHCSNDRVTSEFLWPYKEDVTRFDFEVDSLDLLVASWLQPSKTLL